MGGKRQSWDGEVGRSEPSTAGSEGGIVSCSFCLLYPPREPRSRAQLVPGQLFVCGAESVEG